MSSCDGKCDTIVGRVTYRTHLWCLSEEPHPEHDHYRRGRYVHCGGVEETSIDKR